MNKFLNNDILEENEVKRIAIHERVLWRGVNVFNQVRICRWKDVLLLFRYLKAKKEPWESPVSVNAWKHGIILNEIFPVSQSKYQSREKRNAFLKVITAKALTWYYDLEKCDGACMQLVSQEQASVWYS